MRFLVITNAPTLQQNQMYAAYTPYVKEMDIWFKYVDDVTIISPTSYHQTLLLKPFDKQPKVISISSLVFTSIKNSFSSVLKIPFIIWSIFKACKKADHIHLRCPGNIGLLGCIVQIVFPKKTKTAKYAGNWDPKAIQPWSYKVQKWILSNTFLTKNMQVLVYGDWNNQTKNIKSFFTATYNNSEKKTLLKRDYSGVLKFVFIGSLVSGKRPLLAIQFIEALQQKGKQIHLDVFGDGVLKEELKNYIALNKLDSIVSLHGNQSQDVIKDTLKRAHFSILPSKSEGWPKAIAESMFFGVIPIATGVSCVPFMLDYGKRGILIEADLKLMIIQIEEALKDVNALELMAARAADWSQNYTLEVFENDIYKLLYPS